MHPCHPHHLSPPCRMPHLHCLFHCCLPSSSLARVQQNPFLHRLASHPPVIASLRAQCTRPHLHTRAHCLPHQHPLTLSRITLIHHAHHQPRPLPSLPCTDFASASLSLPSPTIQAIHFPDISLTIPPSFSLESSPQPSPPSTTLNFSPTPLPSPAFNLPPIPASSDSLLLLSRSEERR